MDDLRPTPKKRPRRNEKRVFVEMPTGDRLDWMVVEPCTIENVKERIFHYEGIPVEMQHLVIEAPNDCTISNPVNPNDSSIILSSRWLGVDEPALRIITITMRGDAPGVRLCIIERVPHLLAKRHVCHHTV